MKFFTDSTVNNKFLLIKLRQYIRLKNKDRWDRIYIDPGVYSLKKDKNFPWENKINIDDFLNTLPNNHYFSWDYPSDMNPTYADYFRKRTWENALKYHIHPQYIVTVQFKLNNTPNFIENFDRYNKLNIKSGILGIGNLCRYLRMHPFLKSALDYIFKNTHHHELHIYGLSLRGVVYADKLAKRYNRNWSTDSTKWTKAVSNKLKLEYGLNCSSKTRQLYFDSYLERLKQLGIDMD